MALAAVSDPPPDVIARRLARRVVDGYETPPNALTRLSEMLAADGEEGVYAAIGAFTTRPQAMLSRALAARADDGRLGGHWLGDAVPFESRMLFDSISYLPDDIMVKVDRAAMAWSLETRAPLLDHRVFDFAWRIPFGSKVRDGAGKIPLRTLLYRYVPRDLVERPKRGFAVPLAAWLRGPLRDWAESLLDPVTIRRHDVLSARAVNRMWSQHSSGVADHGSRLWSILALSAFLDAGDR